MPASTFFYDCLDFYSAIKRSLPTSLINYLSFLLATKPSLSNACKTPKIKTENQTTEYETILK